MIPTTVTFDYVTKIQSFFKYPRVDAIKDV